MRLTSCSWRLEMLDWLNGNLRMRGRETKMAIDYKEALEKRDEFANYLHDQIVNWVEANATIEDVTTLAEILLREGWVTFD